MSMKNRVKREDQKDKSRKCVVCNLMSPNTMFRVSGVLRGADPINMAISRYATRENNCQLQLC